MFFIFLGVYLMLFIKQNYLFIVPTIISYIAAYYCKATALIFYISLMFYFLVTYKNGLFLQKIFRLRNLIFFVFIFLTLFLLLEYIFIYYRDYYDNVFLFGRRFRSPAGTVVFWITQRFFTKNPFLSFLSIIYVGYMVILIVEGKPYHNKDLFFVIWLILGTSIFSFISYQPLRYYVYVVFPLIAVAVRSIFSFPSIWKILFEKKNLWLKGTIFVLSFYLLVIHCSFLPFMPVRTKLGWDIQAIELLGVFSVLTIVISTVVYIFLLKKKAVGEVFFRTPYRNFSRIVILLILGVHIIPITRWALNPKYELANISKKINELSNDSIIVGDWAPQLCINTDRKVLYLTMDKKLKRSQNFNNLDKIKPDYLVITSDINDHILRQFNLNYPGVAKDTPHYKLNYAGRTIKFYELNFGEPFL